LQAVLDARSSGIPVFPVWNKSNREHTITGTHPDSLREEADAAVSALGFDGPYYVDADHVAERWVWVDHHLAHLGSAFLVFELPIVLIDEGNEQFYL